MLCQIHPDPNAAFISPIRPRPLSSSDQTVNPNRHRVPTTFAIISSPIAALHRLLRSSTSSIATVSWRSPGRSFSSPVMTFSASKTTVRKLDPSERNVQWVFLCCPGVGKGTYASRLSNLIGVPHIPTGDLVRDELKSSGPFLKQLAEIVNQGNLVSEVGYEPTPSLEVTIRSDHPPSSRPSPSASAPQI